MGEGKFQPLRDPRLTEYAKQMRRAMTEPEKTLWNLLRAKRFLGIKFRRQKVIGSYIVDFASRDPMLVIELDGDSHAFQHDYDNIRTIFLQEQGYRVIRFINSDVMGNMDGVLEQLSKVVAELTAPLPTLSPEGERAK